MIKLRYLINLGSKKLLLYYLRKTKCEQLFGPNEISHVLSMSDAYIWSLTYKYRIKNLHSASASETAQTLPSRHVDEWSSRSSRLYGISVEFIW